MTKISKAIREQVLREHRQEIGSRGGKIGGLASGDCKRRDPAKMRAAGLKRWANKK